MEIHNDGDELMLIRIKYHGLIDNIRLAPGKGYKIGNEDIRIDIR